MLRSQQAATLKGKHHDSAALHHRARDLSADSGRKERTGIRRFFLMESIFFPFAFRMLSAPNPTRPPAREPPATPLFTPGAKSGSQLFKGQQNFFFP
ncbi:hypothetical protein [Paenibacillus illinoisensis]|uniref:hypothetical protein n=1 Tax=Paenibacillus illinoisensis TaxID=59845 RepID=UPI00301E5A1F